MWLIVPTLNQTHGFLDLVSSVDRDDMRVLAIDNGRQGLRDLVASNVHVVELPSNLGVASSWNLGVKSLPFESVWFFASDDVTFAPGALNMIVEAAKTDNVVLSSEWPHWQWFAIGQDVVERVGLFDEAFHPANFEDDDYLRRCEHAGVDVVMIDASHQHLRHATVFSPEFAHRKESTYSVNETYYRAKIEVRDFSEGGWVLNRRRLNGLEV